MLSFEEIWYAMTIDEILALAVDVEDKLLEWIEMIGSGLSSEEVIDTTEVDALVEIELDVANEEVVADTELV
jgi:hypothetical protein